MRMIPDILLCSRDEGLIRRVRACMDPGRGRIQVAASLQEASLLLQDAEPGLLFCDLRMPECRDGMEAFVEDHQDHVIAAFGALRSDPALAMKRAGVFAVEPPDLSADRLRNLIRQAHLQVRLQQKIRTLEEKTSRPIVPSAILPTAPAPVSRERTRALKEISGLFRHVERLDMLLERTVETLASILMVSRTGLILRDERKAGYALTAGWHMPQEAWAMQYPADDPFVAWLERHPHTLTKQTVDASGDMRGTLRRAMDSMGAEVLVPLQARSGMLGWMAVGIRSTGIPFEPPDLEELVVLADHIAVSLERAMLYREVQVQKKLAESLLHSIPTGIVSTDDKGVIQWFSTAAEAILNIPAADVIGRAVEKLGSRMADVARRTLSGDPSGFPMAWKDPLTGRSLFVTANRLTQDNTCLGAVLMIQDMTLQRNLQEKQEQLERTAFWNELAASMSHEIRNPLVAIKTFAQLLPERFNDPEFREEFSKLVSVEVDRLNGIIDQINDFAHPPELSFDPIDIRLPIRSSIDALAERLNGSTNVQIEERYDENLPTVYGDAKALTDCINRLLENAIEALSGKDNARIRLSVDRGRGGDNRETLMIRVADNAGGINNDLRDKLFSPFSTTKARGMGLGLPIVQRTVVDHNGRVQVDSDREGTTVTMILPTSENGSAA